MIKVEVEMPLTGLFFLWELLVEHLRIPEGFESKDVVLTHSISIAFFLS